MNHLWWGKVFDVPRPVLNYGGADIGGAQLMPEPPPKNLGCPDFDIGMPHARSRGDALSGDRNPASQLAPPNAHFKILNRKFLSVLLHFKKKGPCILQGLLFT
jgi:hypothetical protein